MLIGSSPSRPASHGGSAMRPVILMAIVLMSFGCAVAPQSQSGPPSQSPAGTLFQHEREYLTAHPPPAPPAAPAPTGSSTSPRPQLETGQARGGGTVVTTPGSALAHYLTLVDWKIHQNWVPSALAAGPEARVVVRIRVLRTGQVQEVAIEESSGSPTLDSSALQAIRQSLPFPPFPYIITDPFLDLRYQFVMERG